MNPKVSRNQKNNLRKGTLFIVAVVAVGLLIFTLIGDCLVNRALAGIKIDWTQVKDCSY